MQNKPYREGDRVYVTEDQRYGRVTAVFESPAGYYYRVQFGIPSPYPENWAIFRHHELHPQPAPTPKLQPAPPPPDPDPDPPTPSVRRY